MNMNTTIKKQRVNDSAAITTHIFFCRTMFGMAWPQPLSLKVPNHSLPSSKYICIEFRIRKAITGNDNIDI